MQSRTLHNGSVADDSITSIADQVAHYKGVCRVVGLHKAVKLQQAVVALAAISDDCLRIC